MNLMFCKITFNEKIAPFYANNDKKDNIISRFYQEKKGSSPENYNFQDYNGDCYGYVPIKDGVVELNKVKFTNSSELLQKNTTVVWLYFDKKSNKNIVLGWYLKADVYKFLQKKISYPSVGKDLYYNIKTKSSNCFLLPEKERNFDLDIPFCKDLNIFLADENSGEKIKNLVSKTLDYISSYSGDFKNIVFTKEIANKTLKDSVDNPISLAKRGCVYLYNEGNYFEALKFFNTALLYKNKLDKEQLIDIKYCKALCFQFLNAFYFSKTEFEEIIDLGFSNFQINKNLIYLNLLTKDLKKALSLCDKISEKYIEIKKDPILKMEIDFIKIDILIEIGEKTEVIALIEKLKNTTEDENLRLHFGKMLEKIKSV